MKRVLTVSAIFFAGVIFGLLSVHGTFNHLRHTFSPSLSFADGSTYVGNLNAQGELDGNGRMQWKNGDSYEGNFVAGLFQGHGRLSMSASGIYTGNFFAGEMEGQGELVYPDGSRYHGEFKQNRFNGKGKLTYTDGSFYVGDFINGRPHGKGQWLFADQSTYAGDVVNGVITGKGELRRAGSKYLGDFVAGKMHGNGVFTDSEGNSYSGEFQNDIFTGEGVYAGTEGDSAIGHFNAWLLNGKGMQTDKDGNQWQGEFQNGLLEGEGTYIEKLIGKKLVSEKAGSEKTSNESTSSERTGQQYSGEFKFGKYSGKGKLIASNGDIYEGEFAYGKKHGAGVLTYREPIDGVGKITGRWDYDRLVDGGSDVKIFSPEEVTEHAIYKESAGLQRSLDALLPSDEKKIELYSLVIAGYGTEEVFRRESKFIENLFTQQYRNHNTAIYLSNSQRSLDEHPMATRTSIRAAVEKIAERMDKERDIFFLYITSHGSKNKTIALTHNGLALADIDAKWLGDLLKATGIKHRIVVLSACFSGGFIDDIADENTLVMTAASAEKTSFGCADDSLFTYFGKAYFREALKPGVDFEQAFYRARELIESWEKEQKITPSEPQIRINPKVSDYVKSWVESEGAPVSGNLKPQSIQ
ncbi:C13 family peptidase [Cellvibrio mixtus]|uniref:C13 family peptidase n=1 Tax=Cellvibrio mixtus TaxID=39650 RepID=UPI0005866FE6|nr:C13 family peptidase [Cellvibrio mixtus]